jgi:hypothetical protein
MRAHKESGQSVGAEALVALSGFAPPTLHALGARAANSLTRRLFNLVVTNVPGPQYALYAAGARLLEIFPIVPLAEGQAVSIGLTSYNGGVYYGLNADRDAMPDVDVLAALIEESLAELVAASDTVATHRENGGASASPAVAPESGRVAATSTRRSTDATSPGVTHAPESAQHERRQRGAPPNDMSQAQASQPAMSDGLAQPSGATTRGKVALSPSAGSGATAGDGDGPGPGSLRSPRKRSVNRQTAGPSGTGTASTRTTRPGAASDRATGPSPSTASERATGAGTTSERATRRAPDASAEDDA